ncbi:MAG: twin-arginine translocase TatA/TatE family subunit [Chloroflexi bacterium]|nr:twin-arginine translocase TatA/TatE family subunit [Chloroflexota bacterium]
MFGIGAGELIVILALALIIVGPQRLPELGRTLGRTLAELKTHTDELRSVMNFDTSSAPATPVFPGTIGGQSYGGLTERITAMQKRDEPGVVQSVQSVEEPQPEQITPVEARGSLTEIEEREPLAAVTSKAND